MIFILSRLRMLHVWHVITHTHTPRSLNDAVTWSSAGREAPFHVNKTFSFCAPVSRPLLNPVHVFLYFSIFPIKLWSLIWARFMFYSFPKATILQYFPQNRYSINTCKTNDVSKPQINIKHSDWKTTIFLNERSPRTTFKLSASFHFTPIYLEMKKKINKSIK